MFCKELRGSANTALVYYFRASNLWKKVAVTPALIALLREVGGMSTFPLRSLVSSYSNVLFNLQHGHYKTISTHFLDKAAGR